MLLRNRTKKCAELIGASVFFLIPAQSLHAEKTCADLRRAWQNVDSYQCLYRATIFYEGRKSVTEMRYTYQKPDKIRMDIYKPKDGAVLIYNPAVSKKVRVRPFPKLSVFVLNYNLTDRRVSSDSGGTVDRSDLGNRIESYCKGGSSKDKVRRMEVSPASALPAVLEIVDGDKVVEKFEWIDLQVNLKLDPKIFLQFSPQ